MATDNNTVKLTVLGRIHTPFRDSESIPIQGTANTARGTIALAPPFARGLADLEGFDRIWLLYLSPAEEAWQPLIVPRLDDTPRGVFATRSRQRPNPIGLTCVKLLKVEHQTLHVEGVDMLDGCPLLDVKPYVPRFDSFPEAWSGWLENSIPHQDAWQDPD